MRELRSGVRRVGGDADPREEEQCEEHRPSKATHAAEGDEMLDHAHRRRHPARVRIAPDGHDDQKQEGDEKGGDGRRSEDERQPPTEHTDNFLHGKLS